VNRCTIHSIVKTSMVKGCNPMTFQPWNGSGEGCQMIILLFALGAMCGASLAFLAGATWAAMPQLRASFARPRASKPGLTLVGSPAGGEREGFKLAS
jgi:hypothetical protein